MNLPTRPDPSPTISFAALFAYLALLPFSSAAEAAFRGKIEFTEAEMRGHRESISTLLEATAACVQRDLQHHREFFHSYGISPYFGDQSSFSKLTMYGRKSLLRVLGVNPTLAEVLEPTSCIGLTLKCLGQGFEAAGEADLWRRLRGYTVMNGADGSSLQDGLQKLGWKILYWNPDVSRNAEWDNLEKRQKPGNRDHYWGYHQENWLSVTGPRHTYLYNRVDDTSTLVNFGAHVPAAVINVPFFVGVAHMGYHVFPGIYGEIIEAHSTKAINDVETMQSAPFNPLTGGGPTGGLYRSGTIAMPPGYAE